MRAISSALCLLALPLFGEGNFDNRLDLLERKMDSLYSKGEDGGRPTAKFATGRPIYSGYGLWVTGEVLYWTAFEGGTDYAYSSVSGDPSRPIGEVRTARFNWDAGYRLGASYSWPHDNWDLALLFSRINPEANNSLLVTSGTSFFAPVLGAQDLTSVSSASLDWKLKLSTLDFEYGRSYFVSRYLSLRPHFGARLAWIHQKANANYDGLASYERIQLRNDFDGAGIRLGADSKWFLDNHWNLSLVSSVSTLYGHFKVNNNRNLYANTTNVLTYNFDETGNVHRIVPAAQIALGAGWETLFACDRNHISFNVAYELNYWWRQNQIGYFETSQEAPYGTRYSDDLGFHGVTFDMQLSF